MLTLSGAPEAKYAVICIGKTGGTTLSNILYRDLGSPRCLRELQHLPFNVLGHIWRDRMETYLRQMPDSRFNAINLIVGHLPINMGDTLPRAQFKYMTLLREPAARLVSTFFYINRLPPKINADQRNAALHRMISVGGDVIYSNPMTRVFSGSEALVPRSGDVKEPLNSPLSRWRQ